MRTLKLSFCILGVFVFFISASVYADEKPYKTYTDIAELESPDITIQDVVSSSKQFHRKNIVVDGEVTEMEYKKYINGRKFTIFKLIDDKKNSIKVYARGYVTEISNGSKIRIWGRYSKHKRLLFKKYKNVMKAKIIDIFSLS